MKNKLVKYILPLVFFIQTAHCQETLVPAIYNPSAIAPNPFKPNKQKSSYHKPHGTHIKSLPFIDDFSGLSPFPDTAWWANGLAYINTTYCKNQPSIGVATLDALDDNGILYQTSNKHQFNADSLISKFIDLSSYNASDSLQISFYYQTGGLGDPAENEDMLYLLFWNDPLTKYDTVWIAPDRPSTNFNFKMIEITNPNYFNKNFRFQFKIRSSLYTQKETAGMSTNGDIWNIDYVYLDKNRSKDDTVINDIAIYEPLQSMLNDYERMPWKHFILPSGLESQLNNNIKLIVRNNDSILQSVSRKYETFEIYTNTIYPLHGETKSEISGLKIDTFPDYNPEPNTINNLLTAKKAHFQIKAYLYYNYDFLSNNDTTTYNQIFEDYYAYDDGSAEWGYGITGNGAQNAQVACYFKSIKEDTLQAVDIFFNKKVLLSSQTFKLTIWNAKKGKPDTEIYTFPEREPSFEQTGVNKFFRYFYPQKIVLPKEYFIGWKQEKDEFLNIGFDANKYKISIEPYTNNVKNNLIFYNTSGSWMNSMLKGTLMIRPVVGAYSDLLITSEKQLNKVSFAISPNPFKDKIYITLNNMDNNGFIFELHDLSGKKVLNQKILNTKAILNTSHLKQGFYIYRFISTDGTTQSGKIIKR